MPKILNKVENVIKVCQEEVKWQLIEGNDISNDIVIYRRIFGQKKKSGPKKSYANWATNLWAKYS